MKPSCVPKWSVVLASITWSALSGCYETADDGSAKKPPPDDSSEEMSSSDVPRGTAGAASVSPPDTQPTKPPDEPPADPEPMPPVVIDPSVSIESEPGFFFIQARIVGDLDGDGLDDLVSFGLSTFDVDRLPTPRTAAYVFYGRKQLPEALSYANADAVLRGEAFAIPMGNMNTGSAAADFDGDGLVDLAIAARNQTYFVFGDEQRLSGEHEITDVAVTWTFADVAPPDLGGTVRIAGVGDVRGDGLPDLALTVTTEQLITDQDSMGPWPLDTTYLIAGRQGEWPSGTFENEWADTVFVAEPNDTGCSLFGAGDLDGDGFSDLLLQTNAGTRLVLGGDDLPTGTVLASELGAAFELNGRWMRAVPDLDGDGSQEIAWTDALGTDELYLTYGEAVLDLAAPVAADAVVAAEGLSGPAMAVSDIDGDGTQDLLLLAGASSTTPFGLYMISTAGLRGAGEVNLTSAKRLLTIEATDASGAPTRSLGLDAGGDVNGDGIDDLLITTYSVEDSTQLRLLLSGTDLAGG